MWFVFHLCDISPVSVVDIAAAPWYEGSAPPGALRVPSGMSMWHSSALGTSKQQHFVVHLANQKAEKFHGPFKKEREAKSFQVT